MARTSSGRTRPGYLTLLESGDLFRRVGLLIKKLQACKVCPRHCRANRIRNGLGVCETGRFAEVASWCLHRGEEPCISGTKGSGTVFFAHCNLKCIFCQNAQISQLAAPGRGVKTPRQLADIYLELQEMGAHNINWVSPGHVVPQALEALALAARDGLGIPIVYNSNGYDELDTLELLDGVVDIYLPDVKYADDRAADSLSNALGYAYQARSAVKEMWRQVGPLQLDDDGVARHGLLVRHLVLPNRMSQTREVMQFLARSLGRRVAVSLMAQYYPTFQAPGHPFVGRCLQAWEYEEALDAFDDSGLTEGYFQQPGSSDSYRPDFEKEGHPFE
ncbi:MAG: radical SAM protein [Acidobacteriota bacterium]|jgi:putative pyruvate formate lyase activating enzyme